MRPVVLIRLRDVAVALSISGGIEKLCPLQSMLVREHVQGPSQAAGNLSGLSMAVLECVVALAERS